MPRLALAQHTTPSNLELKTFGHALPAVQRNAMQQDTAGKASEVSSRKSASSDVHHGGDDVKDTNFGAFLEDELQSLAERLLREHERRLASRTLQVACYTCHDHKEQDLEKKGEDHALGKANEDPALERKGEDDDDDSSSEEMLKVQSLHGSEMEDLLGEKTAKNEEDMEKRGGSKDVSAVNENLEACASSTVLTRSVALPGTVQGVRGEEEVGNEDVEQDEKVSEEESAFSSVSSTSEKDNLEMQEKLPEHEQKVQTPAEGDSKTARMSVMSSQSDPRSIVLPVPPNAPVPVLGPRESIVQELPILEGSGASFSNSFRRQGTAPARLSQISYCPLPPSRASVNSRLSLTSSSLFAQSSRVGPSLSRSCSEGVRLSNRRASVAQPVEYDKMGEMVFDIHSSWGNNEAFPQSDNRGSMRSRRSQRMSQFLDPNDVKELEDEALRTPAIFKFLSRYVVHPSAMKCMLWDLFGLVLIFYDCVNVPLEVFEPGKSPVTETLEWIIRLFWTMNLLGSFFTGFMKTDGSVELRFHRVARHYALTWLPFDSFVVVFDWAEVAAAAGFAAGGVQRYAVPLRTARLVRSVKLIRLLKAPEITKKITEFIPFSDQLVLLGQIARIMFLFLWISHFVACLWFAVGRMGQESPHIQHSWIEEYNIEGMDLFDQYSRSFLWSMAVFSGDANNILPQNNVERLFVTSMLFLAFVVSAGYVGSITTSMTRLQIITSEQSTKLAILRRYLLDHNISRPLAVRVQRNAQFAMLEQKSHAPETSVELLQVISPPVLMELHFEIYSKVLFLHPFFDCYNDVNSTGIRKLCHLAVDMLSLHQGDILFSNLEVPDVPRMYFVTGGGFQYLQKQDIFNVKEGEWMCEAVLWTRWTHLGTAKAKKKTRLMTLDADAFQDFISTYPSVHASLYAMEFVEYLNGLNKEELRDTCPGEEEATVLVSRAFPEDESSSSEEDEKGQRPSGTSGSWLLPRSVTKNLSDSKEPGSGKQGRVRTSLERRKRSSDRASQTRRAVASVLGSVSRMSKMLHKEDSNSDKRHASR
eukprot:TRINITY_DN8485_c0_g2_i1.p1 TRINITY_DN8485_c0_g2~~TRINITY_DN8485_c0_g2_i1.p1  ORF type:complete len:1040 (+),score=206.77 TRINITY_DN8485_c0_g2_i1:125-3244(+)